jgi:transglutaminase-like putative cysteine protease
MNFWIRIYLMVFFTNIAWAQKGIDPTTDDIQKAIKIRELYSKDDVAILESNENVNFGINKKDAKVFVTTSNKEVLMNINHRADIRKYEFYDSESKIENFNLKYRNEKTAKFSINDEFYKDDDYFYNDARVKYITFDFPVQGYSYIYEMGKKYEDVKYFTSIYFNDEFPVLKKVVNVVVPTWLNVELKEFNFEGNSIQKTKSVDAANKTTTYTYTLNNIPALYKDESAPGRSYIYPHILVLAKSFKDEGKEVTLFNSAADLYKWYKSLIDSMKDDPSVFKDKVAELTSKAKTDEEKIKNIYYWVQDNIRYIAFEDGIAGFKPDESNNVFQKRYGDCKGMANLIKQMLKSAGFDARLAWIGTKHIAYDYSTPSLSVDNHMICALYYKGKKYFLDGTEKYNSLGQYAERIQNKEVMVENGNAFVIEKIQNSPSETNKEIFTATIAIVNGKLKGTCSEIYSGESSSQFLYLYNNLKNDKKKDALESYLSKKNKNILVENITTSDLNNRDQQLKVNYAITIDNKVSDFDNELYVDLEYMNEFKNFELKDRKTDYEFDYKTNYESNITLAIPDGYAVAKLPENLSIQEDNFTIAVTFQQIKNEIICKKTFVFKNAIIKFKELEKWNAFNKSLNTIYKQQIAFAKK